MTQKKRQKTEKMFLKYQFTHDEIHEKGILLATLTQETTAIEAEKKAIVSEFKAKLDSKQAAIDSIGNHINNGYEHRYIECTTIYDEPSPGWKTTYRNDNHEKVSSAPMTADELQLAIDFQSGIKAVETDTPFDDPLVIKVESVLGRSLKDAEKHNLKQNIESGVFSIHGVDLKSLIIG